MTAHRFRAVVAWSRNGAAFGDGRYSRGHRWEFDSGITVPASSAPSSVPLPMSVAEAVDPEEAFVAALSSCHMLFFLHVARGRGFTVDSYRDEPVGIMTRNARGKFVMSGVTLAPLVEFSGERRPDDSEIESMHGEAHEECYLANSVQTEITIAAPER